METELSCLPLATHVLFFANGVDASEKDMRRQIDAVDGIV
jgi:hypothetical protein